MPLRRVWCLLEITASLRERQPPTVLEVVMAPEEVGAFERALVREFDILLVRNCAVHAERADSFIAEDRERIFRALWETLGFEEVNKQVIGRMRVWMAEAGKAALGRLSWDERGESSLIMYLAWLLKDQGKLAEAEPLFREALTVRQRTLGDEHPFSRSSIDALVPVLLLQGKFSEAMPLLSLRFVVASWAGKLFALLLIVISILFAVVALRAIFFMARPAQGYFSLASKLSASQPDL